VIIEDSNGLEFAAGCGAAGVVEFFAVGKEAEDDVGVGGVGCLGGDALVGVLEIMCRDGIAVVPLRVLTEVESPLGVIFLVHP
jgi:hypothetical protein